MGHEQHPSCHFFAKDTFVHSWVNISHSSMREVHKEGGKSGWGVMSNCPHGGFEPDGDSAMVGGRCRSPSHHQRHEPDMRATEVISETILNEQFRLKNIHALKISSRIETRLWRMLSTRPKSHGTMKETDNRWRKESKLSSFWGKIPIYHSCNR